MQKHPRTNDTLHAGDGSVFCPKNSEKLAVRAFRRDAEYCQNLSAASEKFKAFFTVASIPCQCVVLCQRRKTNEQNPVISRWARNS